MNIIDFILMLIFFCAIAVYWHKLQKKRAKERAETAKTHPPETRPPEYAHSLQEMPDNPALKPSILFCKYIAIPIKGAPTGLPFDSRHDSDEFNKSLMTAGFETNEEIKALADSGFNTIAVTPVPLLTSDMLVICITAAKQPPPDTAYKVR